MEWISLKRPRFCLQHYLTYPWDEYGYALNNLRRNLKPAMSGSFDNWFSSGIRGAARADLWTAAWLPADRSAIRAPGLVHRSCR